MSNELTRVRQQLSQIRTQLRKDKILPAIQALHHAITVIIKTPLLKAEKEEFEHMLHDALGSIMEHPKVREIFPLTIIYTKGQERQLLSDVYELLTVVDSTIQDAAKEALKDFETRRERLFNEGQKQLEKGNILEAREAFSKLAKEFKDDPELMGQIGKMYLKYEYYEDAIIYLETALTINPELAYLYNYIGIALRKVGKFDIAEKYYLRASKYLGKDPNLFFNLGRLYIDWGDWEKAIVSASAALKVRPDFMEAKKLRKYAERMKHKNSSVLFEE
ncbi:tetratricopeptide repeat protein [Lawsonia intracellularis]|uniref:GluNAc transferase n=1 Tax=Lawsonia intracellularis (strain PHE/MN1-00) TaxID=363253 RepID=Q1MPN2_LAWIP|nr:tetratricopeptide repeat protein [Lawsonia intracellularis]AGC50422.1 tetratricopeptide repeat domain-containing protein [Lawsonia intracellularis N343]KAA0204445.1 tetratricopeptide repeat protein [Lawsonia intracellularis]MBZ3892870.1 tetratricopeptide repeat protein [Lawsonia intracellularis]OMQ02892.1 hypothetical protein BW722_05390 [Lawsonia intracellularis]RBN32970.1 tetratricopeptide repeat protein [Lawsonia intracellularis]